MTSDAVRFDERWLESGGVRLFLRQTQVVGPVRAEVLVTHGLGEHSGRYTHVAAALARHGLRMWAYDLRGHGRSGGRRGDARRYEDLLEDLACVYSEVAQTGRPLFLMGHSMGAQISLNFLLSRPVACRGAVIASPWLRLAFAPPFWRRLLAHFAALVLPHLRQTTSSIGSRLSRDAAHLASLPDPDLNCHRVSARLFLALQRAGRQALARAAEFTCPLLLLHGSGDSITSHAATAELHARAGSLDKSFILYPDVLHETHNDLGREQVLADAVAWMVQRSAPAPVSAV